MRVQNWLAPVLSVLLPLALAAVAAGQTFDGLNGAYGPAWTYARQPDYPPPLASPAGWGAPQHPAGVPPMTAGPGADAWAGGPPFPGEAGHYAAMPPMQPWPQISPFDHRFSQHYMKDGLWMHDANSRRRQYFTRIEYLRSTTRRPKGHVGHSGALTYKDIVLPIMDEELGLEDLATVFGGTITDPTIQTPGFRFRDEPIEGYFFGHPGFNLYDARDARDTGPARGHGMRLRFGWFEPDDSGFVFEGFWTGQGRNTFDAEREVATRRIVQPGLTRFVTDTEDGFLTPFVPFDSFRVLERNLLNMSGIPVDDGTLIVLEDGTTLGGTTIPYDLEFRLEHRSQTVGTSANWLATPFVNTPHFKVRGVVGGRYMYVRERFGFRGEDSGMAYDNQDLDDPIFPQLKLHSLPNYFDDNEDGIVDNAGLVEDPFVDDDQGRFIRLDLVAELLGIEHPGRYRAFLDSDGTSHMAGPEIGLQYELGGRNLMISGHSKFALLGNFSRQRLRGDNIGDANNIGFGIEDPGDPEPGGIFFDSPLFSPTLEDPNPNAFSDRRNNTRVSPLLEQSVYFDLAVVEYLPLLNRVKILEDATLSLGYTFIYVAEMVRPAESINWTANPREGLFPTLRSRRGGWWTSNWSFGFQIPF